ncbi:MAG: PAS domain S-box protein [Phycisphaerae bacterium]|nr:PAS domain S-box protein [Phycisphaerae bacterium]
MGDARKTKAQLISELQALRAYTFSIERDQAERERVEESLRRSEGEYRRFFELAYDIIYTHDLEGRFTSANPAAVRTYGYPLSEFLTLCIRDVVDPEFVPVAWQNVRKKLDGTTYTEPYELLTRAKDGSPVWVEVSSCLITERGRPIGVQGILRDITERKRVKEELQRARDELEIRVQRRTAELTAANKELQREIAEHKRTEQALRESEVRYRLLAENVTDIIWTTDMDLRFTYISPSTTRLRGFTVEEAMRQSIQEMLAPASYDLAMQVFQELPAPEDMTEKDRRRTWTLDIELVCKDGSTVWTEVKVSILCDEEGRAVGVLGVTRDITERKRVEQEKAQLQEQLHQAQKIEAIGQLSAGMAHDFTNLLNVLLGHAREARRLLPDRHEAGEPLGMVEQVGQEAMDVAKSLLTFSRKMPTRKRPAELRDLVESSTQLLRRMLPATIELALETDSHPPLWVNTDTTQMHLVILNLVINARDAMSGDGTLTVSVGRSTSDGRTDTSAGTEPAYAKITIADTGIGMSDEVKARIFEPFFTTKERGQGTGLGLSIVHGIVEEHGGRIEARSRPGHGSTFTIVLPCVSPEAAIIEGRPLGEGQRAGGVVVLAEGHRLLRELMVSALRSHEHEVIPAGDAGAALECLNKRHDDIDLVILDAELAPRAGLDRLGDVLSSMSQASVILISDEAEPPLKARLGDRAFVLRRPFAMPELGELVGRVLGRSAQGKVEV